MGVNIAAIRQYYFRGQGGNRNALRDLAVPLVGLLFCLGMWLGLPALAKTVGISWFAIGVLYDAWRTKGFRKSPATIDFTET